MKKRTFFIFVLFLIPYIRMKSIPLRFLQMVTLSPVAMEAGRFFYGKLDLKNQKMSTVMEV